MIYKTYLFTDKDPIIDEMRTLWEKCKRPTYDYVTAQGGPAASTIRGWFNGDTVRPQSASVRAFVRALGFDIRFVRPKEPIKWATNAEILAAEAQAKTAREQRKARRLKYVNGRR